MTKERKPNNIGKSSKGEEKFTTRIKSSDDICCSLCGGHDSGEPDCDECGGRGANIYEHYRRMKTEERLSEMFDNQYPEE